jgi:hypothetical protein
MSSASSEVDAVGDFPWSEYLRLKFDEFRRDYIDPISERVMGLETTGVAPSPPPELISVPAEPEIIAPPETSTVGISEEIRDAVHDAVHEEAEEIADAIADAVVEGSEELTPGETAGEDEQLETPEPPPPAEPEEDKPPRRRGGFMDRPVSSLFKQD